MSKLFKSKFLLGVMVVAVLVVGGFSVVASEAFAQQPVVSASDIQYAATVKIGSSGQAALIWQKFFNHYSSANLVADGAFGPLSSAAAKIWQASRSLAADGVMGPMSRASAVAQIGTGVTNPVGGSFPAGCSSTSGYSATTGVACNSGGSLPAGCTSTVGFSPTTGAKCDSSTGGGSTGGALEDGAGDATVTNSTANLETEVLEGSTNTPVLSFKVQSSGSGVEVSNVKVSMTNTDTSGSSTRLERYADKVSVYMGTEKVGSMDVADFTKSGTTYSANIPLSGAVVETGSTNKETFFVKVNAAENIDSADILTNDWTMAVSSTRWVDGSGVTMTDTTTIAKTGTDAATGVVFKSLSAGDLKLTTSKGSGMPVAGNVKISTTGTTDVLVNQFKLKAEGSDMTLNSVSLALSTPGANTLAETTNDVYIKVGSGQVASNDATLVADGTYVFTLDTPLEITEGDTVTFNVYAKINKISATLLAGEDLLVSYSTSNIEDVNGDQIGGGDRTGTATGNTLAFFASGINLEMVSSTAVKSASTTPATVPDSATYSIKFKATNFGDTDLYVDRSTLQNVADASGAGQGVAYKVYKDGVAVAPAVSSYVASSGILSSATNVDDTATDYLIPANSFRDITLTVSFALDKSEATNSDGFYRVAITSVNWGTASNGSNATFYSSNLGDFKTDDLALSDY